MDTNFIKTPTEHSEHSASRDNIFDYNSLRAREARAAKVLQLGAVKFLLGLGIVLSAVGAIYLLFFQHNPLGWLVAALAIFLVMIFVWNTCEIARVPAGSTENINDLLSANVLRTLDRQPTPQSIVNGLYQTRSGRFIALRFGISPERLAHIARELNSDIAPIFSKAREIWRKVDGETVSGGMLMIALIESHPQHEMILRRMKLELADLYTGITWYNHLHGLVKSARRHRRTGGIARDLNFGYIPTLQRFGTNISEQCASAAESQIRLAAHHEIVDKVISIFSSRGRQNVVLTGPNGSGRSTIVDAVASTLMDADAPIPSSLKYQQVFMLNAASLISAASGPGAMETLMMHILNEAYAAKNIIICLDNAQLFFESGIGSVDISNLLLPILEAGRLRMILIMNEQKFLEISASNSTLANAMNKIKVPAADRNETLKILQDQAPLLESKYDVICTFWSLTESYRLGERYIHDIAMPGRALKLLETACHYPDQGFITAESVQQAIEKTQGVKMQTGAAERTQLLHMEELIHQRMIDQTTAVKTVSDALRRAAVGARDDKKPIGTFLFLGPTGVGKTELAKAISEVYFNGENHIVRVDLNEYVTAGDVARLIADGAENSESLTARVLKQPFCVVLLDEIEKAHPQVLTTLLQMLDEGILRDINNNEVSFRDAIIIATSNAGADRIREYVAGGMDLASMKQELINALISSGEFKPEFLNRFDGICVFQSLSKPDLLKVVDLMLASVNKTLASRKITVVLDEDAKVLLVERGYDPQMGARPMRRIVQQTVENLLAKLMLAGAVDDGATVHVTRAMLEDQLS